MFGAAATIDTNCDVATRRQKFKRGTAISAVALPPCQFHLATIHGLVRAYLNALKTLVLHKGDTSKLWAAWQGQSGFHGCSPS
jgi:hypothetical protein